MGSGMGYHVRLTAVDMDRKAEGGAKERERRRQERDIYKTS